MTNLPDHKKGDTFDGQQFTLVINDVPADLTGASIKMDLREKPKLGRVLRLSTTDGGISVTIPSSGVFQIDSQIVDVPAKTYYYDIEITFANGEVKTYIDGLWTITQDVTYG